MKQWSEMMEKHRKEEWEMLKEHLKSQEDILKKLMEEEQASQIKKLEGKHEQWVTGRCSDVLVNREWLLMSLKARFEFIY